MSERLDDVWATRDYPVLRETVRVIDAEPYSLPDESSIAAATGLSTEDVRRAGLALQRRGFVSVDSPADRSVMFTDIAGAAYLVTGLHPDADDALSSLVQALQQAAEQSGDENERSRLRRAADGLLSVSRDVMTGVLTAYLTQQMPR